MYVGEVRTGLIVIIQTPSLCRRFQGTWDNRCTASYLVLCWEWHPRLQVCGVSTPLTAQQSQLEISLKTGIFISFSHTHPPPPFPLTARQVPHTYPKPPTRPLRGHRAKYGYETLGNQRSGPGLA